MNSPAQIPAQCTECGAVAVAPTPGRARYAWRMPVAMLTACVAVALLGTIAHTGRRILPVGNPAPLGRAVAPTFTVDDVQAIADGTRKGDGLFDGVFAIGEAWASELPGDLRLWPEFSTANVPPLEPRHYRPLKKPAPITWSQLTALRDKTTRDRDLAQLLLDAPRTDIRSLSAGLSVPLQAVQPGDPSTYPLKITPDPETLASGTVSIWSLGLPIAWANERRYARDPFYGPSQPFAPLAPRHLFRFDSTEFTIQFVRARDGGGSLHVVAVQWIGALMTIGILVVVWLAVWLLTGGFQARRTRLRRARRACIACGYQMAPPVSLRPSRSAKAIG